MTPNVGKLQPQKTRLTITEGMTAQEVKEKGNLAQKKSICIFDTDGNGKFEGEEVSNFNYTRITVDIKNNEFRLYSRNNKLIEKIDYKQAQEDYVKKVNAFNQKQEWDKKADAEVEKAKQKSPNNVKWQVTEDNRDPSGQGLVNYIDPNTGNTKDEYFDFVTDYDSSKWKIENDYTIKNSKGVVLKKKNAIHPETPLIMMVIL